MARVGGFRSFKIGGTIYPAKPNWTINTGAPKRESVIGQTENHGHKEMAQAPFMEGTITVKPNVSIDAVVNAVGATVTLRGATSDYVLYDGFYVADGDYTTEEGELQIRFEGLKMDVLPITGEL